MSDDTLKKLPPSRRDFMRTLITGAAFATPTLLSFSMNGYSVGGKKAHAASGSVPASGDYCPSVDPGSNQDETVFVSGASELTGLAGDASVVFHMTDVDHSHKNHLNVSWRGGHFLAKCFRAEIIPSEDGTQLYIYTINAVGALDHVMASGTLEVTITGDKATGIVQIYDDGGNLVMEATGDMDRGAITVHYNS